MMTMRESAVGRTKGLQVLGSGSSSTAAHENELTVLDGRLGRWSRWIVCLDVEQPAVAAEAPRRVDDPARLPYAGKNRDASRRVPSRVDRVGAMSRRLREQPTFRTLKIAPLR
jgi:hypothetical protein